MVIGLSCNCHSAPQYFRQFLFARHVQGYLARPLYQGDKALDWAMAHNLLDLATYIHNRSSFVVLVGYNKGDLSDLEWVDINNPDPEREIHGETLLERFA